jgi:hypothetical protein
MIRYLKNTFFIIMAVVLTFTSLQPQIVTANNLFYTNNDIVFYNSSYSGCYDETLSITASPDSEGNQKRVAEYLINTPFEGNSGDPLNAVQMAAILGNIQQESGFNPQAGLGKNYQGIVQWNSDRWRGIDETKTSLDNQLKHITKELDDDLYKKNLDEFWGASNLDDLEKATYAITRHYEIAIKHEDAIKQWTNNTDASSSVQDWSKRIGYAKHLYYTYGSLAKTGYKPSTECGELKSGGMDLSEAKSFMKEYKGLSDSDISKYSINRANCVGGPLANCVAFSQYFINRYTDKKLTKTGNGRDVVRSILSLSGFTDGGTTPAVYAVFSIDDDLYGHTGVVLGIDKDRGVVVIGEAGCGFGSQWTDAREYPLSKFSNGKYTYAYTNVDMGGEKE